MRENKMTAEQLTYWLQGFFELSGATTLNEAQVKILKEHLGLVVKKVTPNTVTIVGGQGIGYDPNPIYIPTVQLVQDVVKPPVDWTITSTADNKVMDIKTELTC